MKNNSAFRAAYAALLTACLPGVLRAASPNQEFTATTVDELTNALTQATANYNKIWVAPGVYHVGSAAMAASTHLNMSTWTGIIAGTGARPEDTVIMAGGAEGEDGSRRIISFAKANITVSNLTFACGYYTAGSGGAANNSTTYFTDCVFSNNYAGNFGGAIDCPKTVRRCKFISNSSKTGGGALRVSGTSWVADSFFTNNTSAKGGVAYYNTFFTNCQFYCNSATSGDGGAVRHEGTAALLFTDCEFVGNKATASGSAVMTCDALTNCVFKGNSGGTRVVYSCKVAVNCEFADNVMQQPIISGGTFVKCRFTGNKGSGANSLPLLTASTNINCYIANNTAGNHNSAAIGASSHFLNCTIVSNYYWNSTYSSTLYSDCVAVNTILAKNYPYDIAAKYSAMTNCLWVTQSTTPSADKAVNCLALTDPKFTDAPNGDYTLSRKSPAREKGYSGENYLALVGATDFLGNPRVKFDGIDLGCYECQSGPPATIVIIR